jgi:tRNA/rRNA methyltransferase
MIDNCRVVLVRPRVAGNLGATARAMRNMGLTELVLVAPEADPSDRQARQLSTHGEAILDRARIVADLGMALADCVLVAATSARTGKLIRGHSGPPDEILPRLAEALPHAAALVFGPEASGLTDEEIARCHYLIHIPADPSYPALNLAQAVAICLYELRRAWLKHATKYAKKSWERAVRPQSSKDKQEEPFPSETLGCATQLSAFAEQERMFAQLRTALEEVHFLYGPKADALMHVLRHLIGRAQPTEMEIGVLFGLARQLRWYVRFHRSE